MREAGRANTEPAGISFLMFLFCRTFLTRLSLLSFLSCDFLTETLMFLSVGGEVALNIGLNVMQRWHQSVMMKGKRGLL